MAFPLVYLLFAFLLFLLLWGILSLVGFYHIFKFGPLGLFPVAVVIVYAAGSYYVMANVYGLMQGVDWQSTAEFLPGLFDMKIGF